MAAAELFRSFIKLFHLFCTASSVWGTGTAAIYSYSDDAMGKELVVIFSAVLLTLSGFLSDCNHVAAAKEKASATTTSPTDAARTSRTSAQ